MALLTPRRSADLANFFGANIKLGWDLYPNLDKHIEMINYLGIKHVRMGFVSGSKENFISLYNATGAKLCLIAGLSSGNQSSLGCAPDTIVATIKSIGKEKIAYIEQPNEQDGFGGFVYKGAGFPSCVALFAKDLHTALKADPYTADIPILGCSVAYYHTASIWIEPYVDYGNCHPYSSDMIPEESSQYGCLREVVGSNSSNRGSRDMHGDTKSTVATEYGYYTSINYAGTDYGNKFPISELANAKYTPRRSLFLFDNPFDNFKHGWLYELRDGGSNLAQKEEKFGLFTSSGVPKESAIVPKESAIALKALISSVTDTGTNALTFTPSPLDITFGGDVSNLQSLLLQKSNGNYVLAVWRKLKSYQDGTSVTRKDINNAPTNLTISLPSIPGAIALVNTMAATKQTITPSQSVSVAVGDSVMLLELTMSAPPVIVSLHDENNYLGAKAEFNAVGSYKLEGDLAYMNNRTTSIKIAPGYKVTIFTLLDFTGNTATYNSSQAGLPNHLSNYASAIKIELA